MSALVLRRSLGETFLIAILIAAGPELCARREPSTEAKALTAQKEEKSPATSQVKRLRFEALNALTDKPAKVESGDDELTKLLKERYNCAQRELNSLVSALVARPQPGPKLEEIFDTIRRLRDSEVELTDKPADQVKVHEKYLKVAKSFEDIQLELQRTGFATPADLDRARYWRLDAEVQLLKAKRQAKAEKSK
jgi:hypothetical protein